MESNINQKLGYLVRKSRLQNGMTQEQLSELAGISSNYMSEIEHGKKNISLKIADKILKGLGINLNEIFDEKLDHINKKTLSTENLVSPIKRF